MAVPFCASCCWSVNWQNMCQTGTRCSGSKACTSSRATYARVDLQKSLHTCTTDEQLLLAYSNCLLLQGFGNVGAWAADILQEHGGRVQAVSDATSAVYNEAGLDVKALRQHVALGKPLGEFTGGQAIPKEEVSLMATAVAAVPPRCCAQCCCHWCSQ